MNWLRGEGAADTADPRRLHSSGVRLPGRVRAQTPRHRPRHRHRHRTLTDTGTRQDRPEVGQQEASPGARRGATGTDCRYWPVPRCARNTSDSPPANVEGQAEARPAPPTRARLVLRRWNERGEERRGEDAMEMRAAGGRLPPSANGKPPPPAMSGAGTRYA